MSIKKKIDPSDVVGTPDIEISNTGDEPVCAHPVLRSAELAQVSDDGRRAQRAHAVTSNVDHRAHRLSNRARDQREQG